MCVPHHRPLLGAFGDQSCCFRVQVSSSSVSITHREKKHSDVVQNGFCRTCFHISVQGSCLHYQLRAGGVLLGQSTQNCGWALRCRGGTLVNSLFCESLFWVCSLMKHKLCYKPLEDSKVIQRVSCVHGLLKTKQPLKYLTDETVPYCPIHFCSVCWLLAWTTTTGRKISSQGWMYMAASI